MLLLIRPFILTMNIQVSWYLKYSNKIRMDDDCLELNDFWVRYMKPYAPKKKKMNGNQ